MTTTGATASCRRSDCFACARWTDAAVSAAERAGGVLRFSPPYEEGRDSVVVFARYAPVAAGETPRPVGARATEMEFHLVRRPGEGVWRIETKRTIAYE